jgi:hydroxymethylglutaryl-CoA lyase
MTEIRITETVRDALQGIDKFVPTAKKIEYTHALLKVGFDCIDVGSFVSPKAVPQMADTEVVIGHLGTESDPTPLMVLVVNETGARKAAGFPQITSICFPYSVSPEFLKRNLKMETAKAKEIVISLLTLPELDRLEKVIYLSMGFGNPYGDDWSLDMLTETAAYFYEAGIRNMPLSDILGEANPERIYQVYNTLIPLFPEVDFGLHLHTRPSDSIEKLEAAYEAGVRSFETVTNGLGGCPFAADELVGNLSTQDFIAFCDQKNIPLQLDRAALEKAIRISNTF